MDIKLDWYKIFNEVAKCQSFSLAAKSLYISQSAVSQSINNLEEALDTILFYRIARGVELTNEGRILYEYTEKAINLFSNGTNHINSFKQLDQGELRIGAGDTITSNYLLEPLKSYSELYPKISLNIYNRTTSEIIQMLKEGKIDIGFINNDVLDDNIDFIPIFEINDVFVANTTFNNILNRAITYKEISQQPLILIEKNTGSRKYIDNIFYSKDIKLKPVLELGSHELLLQFAAKGFGISCVIEEFSKDFITNNNLQVVDLLPKPKSRYIGYAVLKNITNKKSTTAFIELLNNID